MTLKKMTAAGNTFYLLDMNECILDGVLILSQSKVADIKMRILNRDGSEAEMCGNGVRCVGRYLGRNCRVETLSGIKNVEIKGDKISVDMGQIKNPHKVFFYDNKDINCEFVKVLARNVLQMTVFERGVGETLACGTGACAAVIEAIKENYCDYDTNVTVKCKGGDLFVMVSSNGDIILSGDAAMG
ncbi:MAG: hypothetical protein LBH47_01250 [Christensenellaceae bacterium]|jgi:diaminopimelate epimerase|nr:hypothetical protein [Christensenellaceae bacterium]